MSVVELAPIVKTIDVRRSAHEAFRIFTAEISAWWPLESRSRAQSAKGQKAVSVTIEPRVGGRVYETLLDGAELDWGDVRAYEPGRHFAMGWRLGRPPEQTTHVSVRFEPLAADACRVTLTHEGWERLGDQAAQMHGPYANGWAAIFEKAFGDFAGRV